VWAMQRPGTSRASLSRHVADAILLLHKCGYEARQEAWRGFLTCDGTGAGGLTRQAVTGAARRIGLVTSALGQLAVARPAAQRAPTGPRETEENQRRFFVAHRRSTRNTNFFGDCKSIYIENAAKKACRVNRPTPKLQRETGLRREIFRIVPEREPQA
jgi:hypothetical protein